MCFHCRNVIRQATLASGDDVLVFLPTGSKVAINQLIKSMKLFDPVVFTCWQMDEDSQRPWVEIGGEIVKIKDDAYGRIDLSDLEEQLGTLEICFIVQKVLQLLAKICSKWQFRKQIFLKNPIEI